jgi:hypothetical protein
MTLRDEMIKYIRDAYWTTPERLVDHFISLLDKKVQDAGWIVPGEYGEAFNVWKDATHEEVIVGKAIKR